MMNIAPRRIGFVVLCVSLMMIPLTYGTTTGERLHRGNVSNLDRVRFIDSVEKVVLDSLVRTYGVPVFGIVDYFSCGEICPDGYSFWKVGGKWFMQSRGYVDYAICEFLMMGHPSAALYYTRPTKPVIVRRAKDRKILEQAMRRWSSAERGVPCVRDTSPVDSQCRFLRMPVYEVLFRLSQDDTTSHCHCVRREFDPRQFEERLIKVLRRAQ